MSPDTRLIPVPGDLIVWKPAHGSKAGEHVWRVIGCHYGAMGVEDIIEVENVSHKPGWTGEWMTHQLMFIPACLLWECEIRRPRP